MNEVVRFALLGLGVGALYAFASQGLIAIYRGTGVLNFGLGATAIAGVYMQWELQNEHGWPFLASAIVGVAWSAFVPLGDVDLGGVEVGRAERLGETVHQVYLRPRRLEETPQLLQVGLRNAAPRVGDVAQVRSDRPTQPFIYDLRAKTRATDMMKPGNAGSSRSSSFVVRRMAFRPAR